MELVEILGEHRFRRSRGGSPCYMCPRLPGLNWPRLGAPPPALPALAPVVVAVTLAVCCAVVNVAAVATPAPSVVSVTGLVRPKLPQLRLPKETLSLAERKLVRVF